MKDSNDSTSSFSIAKARISNREVCQPLTLSYDLISTNSMFVLTTPTNQAPLSP